MSILFTRALKFFIARQKGGVKGATQIQSVLQSWTATRKWEQKMAMQTLKTVFVNSVILWRQMEREDLLVSSDKFIFQ